MRPPCSSDCDSGRLPAGRRREPAPCVASQSGAAKTAHRPKAAVSVAPIDPDMLREIEEGWAISPAANHSAAPSGLSRFASQAKPAAIIAGALRDPVGLSIIAALIGLAIFSYGALA